MMLGAVAGDIIGSAFEFHPVRITKFELFSAKSTFTDDTVLTIATADCILHNKDYARTFKEYGRRYPNAGYGGNFRRWLFSKDSKSYNSYGNGSAMRVSPVGFAFKTLNDVLKEAECSAAVTHNHPEGIKGAQAVAAAIFLAKRDSDKKLIGEYIQTTFGYKLDRTLNEIRPNYHFDETCQGSVPEAITAFLESDDYEDAVRKAVSLGGDSDTLACMAGGIAQAFYKVIPGYIIKETRKRLDSELLKVVDEFEEKFK
jgi:ADP-ribosylglycohydrolase